mgnify:CR=1 FL=1
MSKLSRSLRRVRQSVQEALGATYELDGCSFTLPAWADDIKRNIKRGNYEAAERRLVVTQIHGERPVVELGGSYGDSLAGLTLAGAISAALYARERTGDPRAAPACAGCA